MFGIFGKGNNILNCAVVLPIYTLKLSKIEINSIKNNIKILKKWDHVIISHKKISNELKIFFEDCDFNFKIIEIDNSNFKSVTSYDQMLRKKWFYKLFESYSYILVTQTDVVIFRDELQKWINLGYDYIGAPWIFKNKSGETSYFVGNGGVSLRKIESFLNSFDRLKLVKCPDWYLEKKGFPNLSWFFLKYIFGTNKFSPYRKLHEDFFWSQLIPSTNKAFKVAPFEKAFEFAIEEFKEKNIINHIHQIPFAIHAWEKNAPKEIYNKVLNLISKED